MRQGGIEMLIRKLVDLLVALLAYKKAKREVKSKKTQLYYKSGKAELIIIRETALEDAKKRLLKGGEVKKMLKDARVAGARSEAVDFTFKIAFWVTLLLGCFVGVFITGIGALMYFIVF
jgi:hypothetical protein